MDSIGKGFDSVVGMQTFGPNVARGTLTSMENGGVQAAVSGLKPNWALIAVDSLGNSLGDSLSRNVAAKGRENAELRAENGRAEASPGPVAHNTVQDVYEAIGGLKGAEIDYYYDRLVTEDWKQYGVPDDVYGFLGLTAPERNVILITEGNDAEEHRRMAAAREAASFGVSLCHLSLQDRQRLSSKRKGLYYR